FRGGAGGAARGGGARRRRATRRPAARGTHRGPAGHGAASDGARVVPRGGDDGREERRGSGGRARVGAIAVAPAADGRGDRAARAPDPGVSGERGGAGGTPGTRARQRSDSEVVRRRKFAHTLSRSGGAAVSPRLLGYSPSPRRPVSPALVIPVAGLPAPHDSRIAPFARSSSRRASGT